MFPTMNRRRFLAVTGGSLPLLSGCLFYSDDPLRLRVSNMHEETWSVAVQIRTRAEELLLEDEYRVPTDSVETGEFTGTPSTVITEASDGRVEELAVAPETEFPACDELSGINVIQLSDGELTLNYSCD